MRFLYDDSSSSSAQEGQKELVCLYKAPERLRCDDFKGCFRVCFCKYGWYGDTSLGIPFEFVCSHYTVFNTKKNSNRQIYTKFSGCNRQFYIKFSGYNRKFQKIKFEV